MSTVIADMEGRASLDRDREWLDWIKFLIETEKTDLRRSVGERADCLKDDLYVQLDICGDGRVVPADFGLESGYCPDDYWITQVAGPVMDESALFCETGLAIGVARQLGKRLLKIPTIHTDCAALRGSVEEGKKILWQQAECTGRLLPECFFAPWIRYIREGVSELLGVSKRRRYSSLSTREYEEMAKSKKVANDEEGIKLATEMIKERFIWEDERVITRLGQMLVRASHQKAHSPEHMESFGVVGRGLEDITHPQIFMVTALANSAIMGQVADSIKLATGLIASHLQDYQLVHWVVCSSTRRTSFEAARVKANNLAQTLELTFKGIERAVAVPAVYDESKGVLVYI